LTQRITILGYVLTVSGIAGTMFSLIIEQSDYDPIAFGVATVSILVAIVGLSLALRLPRGERPVTATTS
jgi:hypothetical protein